jgi:putative ABC transport system permease protein
VIRTALPLGSFEHAVAASAARVGLDRPVTVTSSEAQIARQLGFTKFISMLMSVFAVVSLFLALMGIYAIVSFGVEHRTREIGVRMAVGARPIDVIKTVMRGGVQLSAAGLGLGLLLAMMMGKIMSGMVVGTVTATVATSLVVTVVFGIVTLGASYLPAVRATKVDPVVALRS